MKKKLNDLQCEIRKIQDGVDDYTRRAVPPHAWFLLMRGTRPRPV